jgi:hypothetical protein
MKLKHQYNKYDMQSVYEAGSHKYRLEKSTKEFILPSNGINTHSTSC